MRRVLVCAISCILAAGCGRKAEKEAGENGAPVQVQVEEARRGPIDRIITADAVLFPVNQANVTSKISAPIRRVLVNRGDHVKAGQLLAELENRDLAAAAKESKSQLDQAQAAFQTTTGATVAEALTKAEADAQASEQSYAAAK